MVTISARNTIMTDNLQTLYKATFSAHYNIFQQNFGILILLKGSCQEFGFFFWICPDKKISLYGELSILHEDRCIICAHATGRRWRIRQSKRRAIIFS